MYEEFDAFLHNGIWDLIPPNLSQNLVKCKWVFCIKHPKGGTIECYKLALLSWVFINIRELTIMIHTFSLMVKPTTMRVVLSLVVARGWSLRQIDIGHLMKMSLYICHKLLASLTLTILTIFANSRKMFMISNKLPKLDMLNFNLTFFT